MGSISFWESFWVGGCFYFAQQKKVLFVGRISLENREMWPFETYLISIFRLGFLCVNNKSRGQSAPLLAPLNHSPQKPPYKGVAPTFWGERNTHTVTYFNPRIYCEALLCNKINSILIWISTKSHIIGKKLTGAFTQIPLLFAQWQHKKERERESLWVALARNTCHKSNGKIPIECFH